MPADLGRNALRLSLALVGLCVGAGGAFADATDDAFANQVKPLVEKYCIRCHGDKKPKGGLDLKAYANAAAAVSDRKRWTQVYERVAAEEMPPEDSPQPSKTEREILTHWVQSALSQVDCKTPADPGRVTIRRLNRAEYANTIRDLLGIEFKGAEDFPSDDVGYGFDNIGDVLSVPPLLFEKYLEAAATIAERAIVTPGPDQWPKKVYSATKLPNSSGGNNAGDSRVLASAGEIVFEHDFEAQGRYIIKAKAYGDQAGSEPVKMEIRFDGKPAAKLTVKATEDDPGIYSTKGKATKGKHRIGFAFLNDFYDPNNPDARRRDRNLHLLEVEIQGPTDAPIALPESHKRILFDQKQGGANLTHDEYTREALKRVVRRAYRRAPRSGELDRLVQIVQNVEKSGEPFERGVQTALGAVLTSPHFLFRVEVDHPPVAGAEPLAISDYELASRLSYFLWSSMPDDRLLDLARDKKLRRELEAQVRRMLKDPKSQALVDNFAEQWLQIRNLKTANPDRKQFKSFDEDLREAMRKETTLFFKAIIDEDRPITDLLESDFTFLNGKLAKHYGIPGVEGSEFRRVTLPSGSPRGGLLTQASILTATSNPSRTSPVKRGKWVLEQLLGTPPPPPPPNVPDLKDGRRGGLKGTLRQRMEQHRADPNCATCHAKMDPLGFGLENFDAIGGWREKEGEYAIDSSGTLPGGLSFKGPKELKQILVGKRDQFETAFTSKLMIYALGRGLEFSDRCAVDKITDTLRKNNHKFSSLVIEIVKSDAFLKRSPQGAKP